MAVTNGRHCPSGQDQVEEEHQIMESPFRRPKLQKKELQVGPLGFIPINVRIRGYAG